MPSGVVTSATESAGTRESATAEPSLDRIALARWAGESPSRLERIRKISLPPTKTGALGIGAVDRVSGVALSAWLVSVSEARCSAVESTSTVSGCAAIAEESMATPATES